jgi:integrase
MTKRRRREPVNLWLRGRSFYVEFTWKGTRYGPKSLGPVSRDVAQRQVAEMRLAVIEGRYHERPMPTFGLFAEEFLRWYVAGRRPGSIRRYGSVISRLVEHFDNLPLDQVTTLHLERYKRERAAVRQPGGVNLDLQVIHQMFRLAVTWGHLSQDPSRPVQDLRVNEAKTRVLAPDEEHRLLSACGPHLRPVVIFALHTGLRSHELTTLTWENIDRERRVLTIESGRAKNRRFRTIPLNAVALAALPTLPLQTGEGRVFAYKDWVDSFDLAVARAGLRDVSPHTLRRTFITRALEVGVNVRSVQRWAGHQDVRMTMRYAHPSATYEREAIERLTSQSLQQGVVGRVQSL